MPSLSITTRIRAPIETVFAVATDLPNAAQHIRGIEKIELLTDGPVRVGTKWRETRKMMGREATETLEVTHFEPPRGYTIGCDSCGSYFESSFRFVPEGDDTNATLDVKCEARTIMAKLMSPLGNLMMGKVMRKCIEDDLEDIKRAAEMRTAGATPS